MIEMLLLACLLLLPPTWWFADRNERIYEERTRMIKRISQEAHRLIHERAEWIYLWELYDTVPRWRMFNPFREPRSYWPSELRNLPELKS